MAALICALSGGRPMTSAAPGVVGWKCGARWGVAGVGIGRYPRLIAGSAYSRECSKHGPSHAENSNGIRTSGTFSIRTVAASRHGVPLGSYGVAPIQHGGPAA